MDALIGFQQAGLPVSVVYPLGMPESAAAVMVDPKTGERSLLLSGYGAEGYDKIPGLKALSSIVYSAPLSAEAAAYVRRFPNAPKPVAPPREGFSFGGGDRLCGFGTRAHLRSLSRFPTVFPILAQQSVRENQRLGRTPQGVMDDTMFAVIESGWNGAWGADADHQKTLQDVTEFIAAGFTLVTCDPGEHVLNIPPDRSSFSLDHVRWEELEMSENDAKSLYGQDRHIPIQGSAIEFSATDALRALAKYGNAVAHAKAMYRHAVSLNPQIVFELSVDETDSTTTPAEHYVIASVCSRLGIQLWSIAPRFSGRFNKGVDYVGDLDLFVNEICQHREVALQFGGYKLSVHSGSDKFRIYDYVSEATDGCAHLKTSGTSYLAALQVIAAVDPDLFRQIFELALGRYEEASKSYHVDANIAAYSVAELKELKAEDLPGLVLGYDGRQILHVSFGDILRTYGSEIMTRLAQNEAYHADLLSSHISRHLRPFASEV